MVRLTMSGSGHFLCNFHKPLIGMIQIIRRWRDINVTQLFHVELSLIPYGLRVILILTKCGHSVFS